MTAFRQNLGRRLRGIGVEERAWPGRDDGFTTLLFGGKQFAHFHNDGEIDIRLGKEVIDRERLVRASTSTVHAGRSDDSPWYELKIRSAADVEEAVRLVQLAIVRLQPTKRRAGRHQ